MSIQKNNLFRSLSAALVAVGAMLPIHAASAAAQAPTSADETWKRAKFPFLYQADIAQITVQEAPVQRDWQENWKRAKYPWLYTTSAVGSAQAVTSQLSPGSAEAWRAAKFPLFYPSH